MYTLDIQTGPKGGPRIPHPAFDADIEQARASIGKLADLGPSIVWAGMPNRSPATWSPSSSRPPPRRSNVRPVGRRHRQRTKLVAPLSQYSDAEGNALALRGALKPATRREYAETLTGGLNREDARERAIELLFERLAASWTISGLETSRQKELIGRYRMATPAEREFVLESLRAHLAEHFPELDVP